MPKFASLFVLVALLAGCGDGAVAPASAGQPCSTGCGQGTACNTQSQICTCPSGSVLCGAVCVNPQTDAANCGACGLACPGGQACANGRCSGGGCPTGALDCSGLCVDPRSNAQHCGSCARACNDGEACTNGNCVQAPCPFGASLCGGRCVNLASSATDCGMCGRVCGAGQTCVKGQCASAGSCPAGLTMCGGTCVDTNHDPLNCGGCGTVCDKNNICARDGGTVKCRDYKFAGCNTCPCSLCGDRSCCQLPMAGGGYATLCVEDQCPLP